MNTVCFVSWLQDECAVCCKFWHQALHCKSGLLQQHSLPSVTLTQVVAISLVAAYLTPCDQERLLIKTVERVTYI